LPGRSLGLQLLEGAQRAVELGLRAAAVAHQGLDAAGAVAVADQRQGEAVFAALAVCEQLGLDALGALEPPGGAHDPAGQQPLHHALGCQLREHRGLQRGEGLRVLVVEHEVFLGAEAVPEGVLRRARLSFGGLGTARRGAVAARRRGARGREREGHANNPRCGGAG
jgi:hypothetical protein